MTDKKLSLECKEIKRPDREAQLVAENIATQLENRVAYRRAIKSAMGRATKAGVQGIKAAVSGRLNGYNSSSDIESKYRLRFCRSGHYLW